VPLAESTGAIIPLSDWILEEACRQAASWGRVGAGRRLNGGERFISVNLSAVRLAADGFAEHLAHTLTTTGVEARQLMLEVTESARLDQEFALAAARRVRALGVRFAIDDFGTGYASLSQIFRVPVSMLKIDVTFVAALDSGSSSDAARAESLITGILDLARRLGVSVVAEGIENADQVARLRALGCELGQGFHFAPGLPADELETLVRGWAVLRQPSARLSRGGVAAGPSRGGPARRPMPRPAG
jgi:EAL domain-containing protein (putative c-di-GMP-specific phosphodiesterase class I)